MHSRAADDDEAAPTAVGELLRQFKYGGDRSLARVLGRRMAEVVASHEESRGIDIVVHVPNARRPGRAGPCRDLARALAGALRVRCLPGLIAQARRVAFQKDLTSLAEKRENVRGAFRVRRPELLRDRKVLLIDDVYDSGATLEEVWRLLMAAGAREVVVAAVTRTRYRQAG